MYKNVLQNIEGIELFPLISFGIFFIFFVSLLIYIMKADKKFINEMKQMPLQVSEDNVSSTQKSQRYE